MPPSRKRQRLSSQLTDEIVGCRACPRLVTWREKVAREKKRMYLTHEYWGRPVPAFGDPDACIVFVGLAPAAHGANRTGRVFTGDRSGDFLFAGLFRDREIALFYKCRVLVALGAIAWEACLQHFARRGIEIPRPRPRFAHGSEIILNKNAPALLGSFHVSQQNTQTGRLTTAMFDAVLQRAKALASTETAF